MKPEIGRRWFFPGQAKRLEKELDRRAGLGLRPVRLGRFRQVYEPGDGVCCRLDWQGDPAAWTAAGWTLLGERKGWRLYALPWDGTAPAPRVPTDRTDLHAKYDRRKRTCGTLRTVLLLLSALLFLLGYALDLRYMIYSGTLPLALCIPLTYGIKFLEELD